MSTPLTPFARSLEFRCVTVDMGKGGHHAAAKDRKGMRLLDSAWSNDETKLRALLGKFKEQRQVWLVVDSTRWPLVSQAREADPWSTGEVRRDGGAGRNTIASGAIHLADGVAVGVCVCSSAANQPDRVRSIIPSGAGIVIPCVTRARGRVGFTLSWFCGAENYAF